MRGYNRQKADLQPYPSIAKSREEIAADIAAGNPSPVEYKATVTKWTLGGVKQVDVTPVHLRREVK